MENQHRSSPAAVAPSIVLTCTIDVKGIGQMARSAIEDRLADYRQALDKWMHADAVSNIILVENSGYDLSVLQQAVERHAAEGRRKNVEFLSIDTQDFPRGLGKGYGETLALQHVASASRQLRTTGRFIKVNGRYFIRNIDAVLDNFEPGSEIFCNLTKSMRWSDSRLFGGSLRFLSEFVCPMGLTVNDEKGRYFEHALADAFLTGVTQGLRWQFITHRYDIDGIAGTANHSYSENLATRKLKDLANATKQKLLRL